MKICISFMIAAFAAGTFLIVPNSFGQGSLAPPGSPARVMKSPVQIEPRTPISSVPFTLSTAGSYFLKTNLTPAVNQNDLVIATDNITVDLNGFTLFGGGGGPAKEFLPPAREQTFSSATAPCPIGRVQE